MRIIILIILLGIMFILIGCGGQGQYDQLAKCLSKNGAIMYGTEWCSHCQNQKKMFGESFQYINFVDCDQYKDRCATNGIEGYPTWIIDGQKYPGEQSLNRLASLAKCQLS
jgi:hypothetical protein